MQVAAPSRPSVAYVGDGAWGMSLAEVLTCVRERVPAIAVVFNNGQWGAEKKNQVDFYADRFVGTNLDNPSFAEISRAMGGRGLTAEKPEEVGVGKTYLFKVFLLPCTSAGASQCEGFFCRNFDCVLLKVCDSDDRFFLQFFKGWPCPP